AGGMLVARAVPELKRPDVAYALHAPQLARSGFSIFREWIDPRRFEWNDLRVYATSLDGKASPLNTHWGPPPERWSDLQLDDRTSIPIIPGAADGWVDTAEEEEERVTPFELPVGMAPSAASGIEFDAEVSRSSSILV